MLVLLLAIMSKRQLSEVAAISCKEPFLVLHRDKVMLRPRTHCSPIPLSGCSSPKGNFPLLSGSVKVYLSAIASLARLIFLVFTLHKSTPTSQSTSRWLRQTIIQTYDPKDGVHPYLLKHCTLCEIFECFLLFTRAFKFYQYSRYYLPYFCFFISTRWIFRPHLIPVLQVALWAVGSPLLSVVFLGGLAFAAVLPSHLSDCFWTSWQSKISCIPREMNKTI